MATTTQQPSLPITQRFSHWLTERTDGHVLGLFRLLFGLFMLYECWHYAEVELIDAGLLAPKILFKFEGFEWLGLLPRTGLQVVLGSMAMGAALLATGIWHRLGGWMFALGQAYFMLQEKAYFNNHIYLFILVSALLTFTDADRFLSLRGNRGYGTTVPRWQVFILQLQVVIVYFYGGVAKINADWLFRQEPVRTLLQLISPDFWLAPVLRTEFGAYLLTYGGFILDLFAPVFLFYRPVRRWTWWFFIGFHLTNSRLFDDIGVFPFVMLAAMILYFETGEIPLLRRLVAERASKDSKSSKKPGELSKVAASTPVLITSAGTRYFLTGWFVFQLLFPLRGYFLPNSMDYTTVGNRFSWHMKIDTRTPEEMAFLVQDPVSQQEQRVEIQTFINDIQLRHLAIDPRSAAAFARMLQTEVAQRGMPNAKVKARIRFRYNNRPSQYFVNPEADLTKVDVNPFKKYDWVIPVK